MALETKFVAEVFARYGEHLISVITSIETQMSFYEKSKAELERLVKYKPEKYQSELEKIENKIKEADIKLSYIVPRLTRIYEDLNEINQSGLIEANDEINKLIDKFLKKNTDK